MDTFYFRKLNVYQRSEDLVIYGYNLMKKYPKNENYDLCDQLRRSLISIPSNIAEGMGRPSDKDKAHFIGISYGSLMEVLCQFEISMRLEYIQPSEFEHVENEIRIIAKELSGLTRSILGNKPGNNSILFTKK